MGSAGVSTGLVGVPSTGRDVLSVAMPQPNWAGRFLNPPNPIAARSHLLSPREKIARIVLSVQPVEPVPKWSDAEQILLTERDSPTSRGTERAMPGTLIPDYELVQRIGAGSYGEVWLARNVLGALRAVKVIHRSRFNDERPFEREFEGIQRFEPISRSHPSQLAILHVGRNDAAGCFYYVMELADHYCPGIEGCHCGFGQCLQVPDG